MYYAFVVNPVAGNGYALLTMNRLEETLKTRGAEYRIFHTEKPGHATEIALRLSSDPEAAIVASVGGDGTAGEVAAGLVNTSKPFGIIPAGTGNDYIKSCGIPNDPMKALEILLSGRTVLTDTGYVNDLFFLNVCGTGFDVTVLDYAENEKEKHRGLLPYFLGLVKAIFHYRPVHLAIRADGIDEEGDYLICSVANGRFIGGGIPICPLAEVDDGKLDLVLIRNIPRWKIPFYLPGLMLSKALNFKVTRHFRVNEARIRGGKLRVNIDGEIRSMSEVSFKINPSSLNLIR